MTPQRMVDLGEGFLVTSPFLAKFQGSLNYCVKIELTLLLLWKCLLKLEP